MALISEMSDLVAAKKHAFARKLLALLLVIPAALFLFTAYVMGTIALLFWLESYYSTVSAFLMLGGGYAFIGCVVLIIAKWQSQPKQIEPAVSSYPGMNGAHLANAATDAVQKMATKNLSTSLLITLLAGIVYGVSQQRKTD